MRLLLSLMLLSGPCFAANMAAHHAVYKLQLDTSKPQNVIAAVGTMTFDVVDSCAAGWTTSQHMVIDLTDNDGREVHMASDYATIESKDGTHLEFHTKQITGRNVTEQLDGTAVLDRVGGPGHADFTNPQSTHVLLPEGTKLPLAHTKALIEAAERGAKFLSAPLFDGTGADGAQDSFVTIESWQKPGPHRFAELAKLAFGRVHIAFFDRSVAAETPSYEMGMVYFANGVADSLKMDFGSFVMAGALEQFSLKPPSHC